MTLSQGSWTLIAGIKVVDGSASSDVSQNGGRLFYILNILTDAQFNSD